jgi:hypothetical protein
MVVYDCKGVAEVIIRSGNPVSDVYVGVVTDTATAACPDDNRSFLA